MDSKCDEFLELYNDIDQLLQDKYRDYDRNRSMIMRYCEELQASSNAKIYERGRILNSLRQFRNALIHDYDMNRDGLFAITDKAIAFLKEELINLRNPRRAIDIGTKYETLLYGTLDTLIYPLLYKMLMKGFMQMPIVDSKGVLIGVFSPNTLLRYASEHQNEIKNDSKISQVKEYIYIEKHISEYYEFIKRDEILPNIVNMFDTYTKRGKKLVMIFVTQNGRSDEPIQAIITPYDVVNADNK